MQKSHSYSLVLLIISTICLATFSESCKNREENLETKKATDEVANKMKELLSKPNQEAIALLSKKYGTDADTIEKIIDYYLTETDFTYRILKESREFERTKHDIAIASGALDKFVYLELVNQLSQRFSLDSSIVASILYDYRLWDIANEAAQSISND